MPERNHEVVIDGYVFPDTVTVTLTNDEYIDSRDYVGKELYESVCGANDAWQTENARLRELMSVMAYCNQFRRDCDGCSMNGSAGIITERAGCDELLVRLRELGVEVGAMNKLPEAGVTVIKQVVQFRYECPCCHEQVITDAYPSDCWELFNGNMTGECPACGEQFSLYYEDEIG